MEVASPLDGGQKNRIFDSHLVERFEYEILINEDAGIPGLKRARKLAIGIHDDGNTLEFKEKKSSDPSLLVIPLRDIMAANPITIQTRHVMTNREDLLVQIDLLRSDTQTENISIRFKMDRGRISTLLDQIQR